MFNDIRKLFSKHPLYKLKEIKSVRPYYIGEIKLKKFVDHASCFFEPNNMIHSVYEKRKKVTKALLVDFDKQDFLILTFNNSSIKIHDAELMVDVHIEVKQELQLGSKFSLFKEGMIRDTGCCGIIIIFRKKQDQILTDLTNCFGAW